MSSTWALFVDAGWVFAAGSSSAFGETVGRRELAWDPEALVAALVEEATQLVPEGAELLRTYWYDGAPQRLPIGEQVTVAALENVKLRLGRQVRDGQKGVDGLIIHDLITLAYRQTITDAVVVSGDEDLLEAIESAQANGARVHLLEIPIGGITPTLLSAMDRRRVVDESFWTDHLHLAAELQPAERTERTEPAGTDVSQQIPETAAPQVVSAMPRPPVRPAWLDEPLFDAPSRSFDARAGAEMAEEWAAEADADTYAELLAARPYLPADLDARLLRRASEDGAWLTQGERRVLRDAFWSALTRLGPGGERHPA